MNTKTATLATCLTGGFALVLSLAQPAAAVGTYGDEAKVLIAAADEGGHGGEHGQKEEAGPDEHDEAASKHAAHMVGELRARAHELVTHSLLVALSVDKEENLEHLTEEAQSVAEMLAGLRNGDEAVTRPELVKELDKVSGAWARLNPTIRAIVDSKDVTAEQVAMLAERSDPLIRALDKAVKSFEYFATGGRAFSVLTGTVNAAEEQHALVQKMTKEYLLIIYGHEIERYELRFAKSHARFGRLLKALVEGDQELSVMAVPVPEIKEQIQIVKRLWSDFLPLIQSAASSRDRNPKVIDDVTHKGERLAAEVDETVELFVKL